MILEFICNIFFGLVNLIIKILPQFPSFESLNVDLSAFFTVISMLNTFVDLKVVSCCGLIILLVYNIRFVLSILNWLIKKIPGLS